MKDLGQEKPKIRILKSLAGTTSIKIDAVLHFGTLYTKHQERIKFFDFGLVPHFRHLSFRGSLVNDNSHRLAKPTKLTQPINFIVIDNW